MWTYFYYSFEIRFIEFFIAHNLTRPRTPMFTLDEKEDHIMFTINELIAVFDTCGAVRISLFLIISPFQKQPPGGVLSKRCSENMQQIYRRTPMPKCGFNKVAKQSNFIEMALRYGCSPVNLLHIFRTPFNKNTSGWLLLSFVSS